MTNFDIFLSEPKFASFAEVAVSAEKILNIDPVACVLNYRRAMERTDIVEQMTITNLSFRSLLTKHSFCLTA